MDQYVTLGDFAVGDILTQKHVRNRAVKHVCKRAGRTNQRKAREPFHKSVCVGVQWIKSRSVAQVMSFWDFENSLKDSEGGHFSRREAAVYHTPATALGIFRAAWAGQQSAVRWREVLRHAP